MTTLEGETERKFIEAKTEGGERSDTRRVSNRSRQFLNEIFASAFVGSN